MSIMFISLDLNGLPSIRHWSFPFDLNDLFIFEIKVTAPIRVTTIISNPIVICIVSGIRREVNAVITVVIVAVVVIITARHPPETSEVEGGRRERTTSHPHRLTTTTTAADLRTGKEMKNRVRKKSSDSAQ